MRKHFVSHEAKNIMVWTADGPKFHVPSIWKGKTVGNENPTRAYQAQVRCLNHHYTTPMPALKVHLIKSVCLLWARNHYGFPGNTSLLLCVCHVGSIEATILSAQSFELPLHWLHTFQGDWPMTAVVISSLAANPLPYGWDVNIPTCCSHIGTTHFGGLAGEIDSFREKFVVNSQIPVAIMLSHSKHVNRPKCY